MELVYELAVGFLLVATGYFIGTVHQTMRMREADGTEGPTEQLDDGTMEYEEDGTTMNVQENSSIADVPPTTCWVCGKSDFDKEVDRNLHIQTEHTDEERAFAATTGKTMDPGYEFLGSE